jgi:hypothetical protein
MTQLPDSSILHHLLLIIIIIIIIITEIVLKLSEEVGHFRKDSEIFKMIMETIITTERPSAICALARRDVSSAAAKNSGMKIYTNMLYQLAVSRCPRIRNFLLIL